MIMTQNHASALTLCCAYSALLLDKMLMKKATLWLMPPSSVSKKLEANIVYLSHECDGGVPFVPHVSVVGGISCESPEDFEEVTETLRAGLQGTGGIPCRFKKDVVNMYNADDTLVWNQACVSVMERSGEFMALHERARKLLGIEDENWDFPGPLHEPHLSHYYGKQVPPSAEDVVASPDFVAEEVALWETSGGYEGVKNWKELARIRLS